MGSQQSCTHGRRALTTPAWDEPLHAVPADLALFESYTRDIDHARASERPTDDDYARAFR